MRILLDTHLVLWTLTGDAQLGTLAQQLLLDAGNQIYVSAANVWA
jgi:PIN domain nuclease of toxin-antitoxin system